MGILESITNYGEKAIGVSTSGWEQATGTQYLDFSRTEWALMVARDTADKLITHIGAVALPVTEQKSKIVD